MGFIKHIIEKRNDRIKASNDLCDAYIEYMNSAIDEINTLLSNKTEFVDPDFVNQWCNKHGHMIDEIKNDALKGTKKAQTFKQLLVIQADFIQCAGLLKAKIAEHNNQVANSKVQSAYAIMGNVEGRKLDKQQMLCILKEAHNHLVIAGAGTG